MQHRRTIALALFVSSAALACTSGERASDTAAAASDTGAKAATPATATGNEVTITATEFKFDMPQQIPAGLTTFKLVDAGKAPHHASLFKLTEEKTFDDFTAAMRTMRPGTPPPSWVIPIGGPNAVMGGATGNATVNIEPGNYAVVCFIPDEKGTPHFAHGMVAGFVATGTAAPNPATHPTADVTVRLSDYKFEWSKPLTSGQHTIRVETVPGQPHEVTLFKLMPGKTMAELRKWVTDFQGPPPAEAVGGVAALAAGVPSYFTIDLQPGIYAAVCFLEDAKDHRMHHLHGMIEEIRVS